MALDDDIRILSGVRLFEGFTHEQMRLVAFGAETISLAPGRKLFSESAPADCAFVIAAGEVSLYRQNGERRDTIGVYGPGVILGELALIAETERLTSAVTQTEVRVIRLSRTTFRRILEEFPETAVTLHRRLSADLEAMVAQFGAVAAKLEQ